MRHREWSPEQREAARQKAQERWAAKTGNIGRKPHGLSGPLTVSESPPPSAPPEKSEPGESRVPSDASDPLKELAALVVQAVSKDAEQDKILDQFTSLVSRIDFKKHPELRDHPAMQNLLQQAFDAEQKAPKPTSRLAPGTVMGDKIN